MTLLILFPAVLVFLYSLYRLVKDDYVFIRKGISLEHAFDIAFICLWISLFFSRLFYLLFHLPTVGNIFLQFLSVRHGGFSLLGAIIGGFIALYILSLYKRLPLGRMGDFLCISLLFSFPVGFLISAGIGKKSETLFMLLSAILYILIVVFVIQFLYPKLMSRTIKEGTVSIVFLMFFSVITLLVNFLSVLKNIHLFLSLQSLVGLLLLVFSIGLFLKVQQPFTKIKRSQFRS